MVTRSRVHANTRRGARQQEPIRRTAAFGIRPSRRAVAIVAFSITAAGGCTEAERPTRPVEIVDSGTRPVPCVALEQAQAGAQTGEVRIEHTPNPPCRAVARRTGVALRPSADGSRPDPSWTSVVRDSRGRFYTAATGATGEGTFLAWNADGSFLQSIGRPGQGPGELLGRGLPTLFTGPGDSVFVREGMRWLVFGPEFAFGRLFVADGIVGRRGSTHVAADGRIVSTAPSGGDGFWFHVTASGDRAANAFGPIGDAAGGVIRRPEERMSAYAGGRTFWVAPPPGAPDGYVLEEWTLDGEQVRTVRREAPWFVSDLEGRPALPLVTALHIDDRGLLWTTIVVKDARWRELQPGEDEDALMTELYDLRYDVLDPDAGKVLASGVIDVLPGEDERNTPPVGLFVPGTALSYVPQSDSLDFQTIEFFELLLVDER
jgi:hypothetical protein